MRFKSIRMRTLVMILPMVLITLVVMSGVSYQYAIQLINTEINEKMDFSSNDTVQSIRNILVEHSRIPELLARMTETSGKDLTKSKYIAILKSAITANENTLGAGLWFEPYAMSAMDKYYGPYVYKDGTSMIETLDYEDPTYDYFAWDWYTMGKNTDLKVVWSDPYYDETSGITMITCTAPMYDRGGKFIGVTTGDVDLVSLQALINGIQIGEGGGAFLLGKDGTYIAHENTEKQMLAKIQDDSNMADLVTALTTDSKGQASYTDQGRKFKSYFTKLEETGWTLVVSVPEDELYAALQALLLRNAIIILVATVVIIVGVSLFSKSIKNRIDAVNDFSAELAKGNLTQLLRSDEQDEIGQMTQNLNTMVESFRRVVGDVVVNVVSLVDTSNHLAEGADQTQKANEQIADTMQGVAQQKSDEQRIFINAFDVSNTNFETMNSISKTMHQVAASTEKTAVEAKQGDLVVSNSIAQMKKINEVVKFASEGVNQLGEKSKQIGEIISLITSISEQTNLLALNAAIEAARAGEHGRGFAVVADEVRKLAEQSGHAADNIGALVQSIQSEITHSVSSMAEGTRSAETGIVLIEQAGSSFGAIKAAVSDIEQQVKAVEAIIEQLNQNTHVLSQSMNQLSGLSANSLEGIESIAAAVEEQAAMAKEVSQVASNLSAMSSELKADINHFKLT